MDESLITLEALEVWADVRLKLQRDVTTSTTAMLTLMTTEALATNIKGPAAAVAMMRRLAMRASLRT
jgi:hypothetical protein